MTLTSNCDKCRKKELIRTNRQTDKQTNKQTNKNTNRLKALPEQEPISRIPIPKRPLSQSPILPHNRVPPSGKSFLKENSSFVKKVMQSMDYKKKQFQIVKQLKVLLNRC